MIYEQNIVRISTNLVKILFHFWDFCVAPNFLDLPWIISFSVQKYRNKEVGSKNIGQKESVKVWETWNQAVRKERGRYAKSTKDLILHLQAELSSKVQNICWK